MAIEIFKSTAYVVLKGNEILKSTGYAVITPQSSFTKSTAYAVITPQSSFTKSTGYAVAEPEYPPIESLRIDTPHVEDRFPECVSFGSRGGPGFKTSIFEMDSGVTSTEIEWDRIRARYDVALDHVGPTHIASVEDFFYGTRGAALSFRFKDWSDYIISNQVVAIGDGSTTSFQLFKRYLSGGIAFDRIIKKPVAGTYSITVDGVASVIDTDVFLHANTGYITFTTAPADGAVVAVVQGEFDVPVRFDSDQLLIGFSDWQQYSVGSVPMIEVLI